MNGQTVSARTVVTADRAAGEWDSFVFRGDFDLDGTDRVGIRFLNDRYGGTPDTDRNLYVDSVAVNGADTHQSAALLSNGTHDFTVGSNAPTPSDADLLADVSVGAASAMAFTAGPQAEAPVASAAPSEPYAATALSGLDLGAAASLTAPAGSAVHDDPAVDGSGAFPLDVPASSTSTVLPALQTTHV